MRRGLINSWIIAIISLSMIIAIYSFYMINNQVQSVESGYVTELARWYADLQNATSVAIVNGSLKRDCLPLIQDLNTTAYSVYADSYGRRRIVYFNRTDSLIAVQERYVKEYPPLIAFENPNRTSVDKTIDCTPGERNITWRLCDADLDRVNVTLNISNSTENFWKVVNFINCTSYKRCCEAYDPCKDDDIGGGIYNLNVSVTDGNRKDEDYVFKVFIDKTAPAMQSGLHNTTDIICS